MHIIGNNYFTGWKKTLVLFAIGATAGSGFFVIQYLNSKQDDINIMDNWVCHDKGINKSVMMHLNMTPTFISQNGIKSENYQLIDDKNMLNDYVVNIDNKKYADIIQHKTDRIEYKTSKTSYSCKRSSSFNNIDDFKGKWEGILNTPKIDKSKVSNNQKTVADENKVTITLYKDSIFIKTENLPDDYKPSKIKSSIQENGELTIKLQSKTKETPVIKFRIINNEELELLPDNKLNTLPTYFKRVDKA